MAAKSLPEPQAQLLDLFARLNEHPTGNFAEVFEDEEIAPA